MKKYIKILIVALVLTGFVSCEDDDLSGLDAQPKSTATTDVTSITISEGEDAVIHFTIDQAINKPSQFKIELVGGNGTQDDITAGDHTTDADTGIPGIGFEQTVPAFADSFDIPVSALFDADVCEPMELVQLRITAAGVRTILTPTSEGYVIDLNIVNTITWNLDTVDTYGDSWNGALIRATIDGEVTEYTNDGSTETDTQTFSIIVPLDADYSFEFVSGDWDGEIEYVLTAPDGTEFADAYYPAVGVITSGTQGPPCD